MNSFDISVYDNVSTPEILSKSYIYRKLNDLFHVNTETEERIYCPLCIRSFSFKFSLFEHLRTFHEQFLAQASRQTLKFKQCPFCQAKFYGTHLTAKHVLHHHSKVIKEQFVSKSRSQCFLCNLKLNKEDLRSIVNHIEEFHILDFEEEFEKMFSTHEISMSESINSALGDKDLHCTHWTNVCMKFEKPTNNESHLKNFDEASGINCYDFTEMKQQLENTMDLKGINNRDVNTSKSILKGIRHCKIPRRSARRVLRFDRPFNNDEDKENLALEKDLCLKDICMDEYSLYDIKASFFLTSNNTFNESPQYSSTPNLKWSKTIKEHQKSNVHDKSNFKSYVFKKN